MATLFEDNLLKAGYELIMAMDGGRYRHDGVLLENVLRNAGRGVVTEEHVRQLAGWHRDGAAR